MRYITLLSYMKPRQTLMLIGLTIVLSNFASAHIAPTIDLDQIDRELSEKPNDVSLLTDKAHALIQRGRLNEAEVVLTGIEKLESVRSADATYTQILLYHLKGEDEKAHKLSDWGLKQYPNDYYQWDIRSRLAIKAEDWTEAIKALSQCVTVDPEKDSYNFVLLTRMFLMRDNPGDKEKALSILSERISKIADKTETSQLLQLAISINLDLKRYDDAIGNIAGLEKLYGKQIAYEVRRAKIYEQAGRLEKAVASYESAISMIDSTPKHSQSKQTDRMKVQYIEAKDSILAKLKPKI